MKNVDINSVNTLKFSGSRIGDLPFSVCWVSASDKSNADSLTYRNHHHAFFELHVITSGSMDYGADGRSLTVRGGEFMLIPPKCVHRVICCDDSFVKLTVAFNLKDETAVCPELLAGKPFVRRISADMARDVEGLLSGAAQKSFYRTELVELSVIGAVLRAFEAVGVTRAVRKDEGCDDRVLKAKSLIEDNTDIFFTCEDLASYCRMSAKQLGRLFKKYEGVGLLEYVHRQKTETAKRMLAELDLPQKKIAELLGFSDSRYFGKFFTHNTGMTPAEYKKSIRKD